MSPSGRRKEEEKEVLHICTLINMLHLKKPTQLQQLKSNDSTAQRSKVKQQIKETLSCFRLQRQPTTKRSVTSLTCDWRRWTGEPTSGGHEEREEKQSQHASVKRDKLH